jgi:uncharacterized membrane protein YhaH (DUF805 family)
MRAFIILSGAVVFICMLILSYSHTADFFARGGYHGRFAHIGVIACELLFFMSNTVIIVCRLKNREVPKEIRLSSIISAVVVGYANVSSGFNHGIEGIVIGFLILVVLIVSELVVSAAIMSSNADNNAGQSDNNTDTADNSATSTRENDTDNSNTATTTAAENEKPADNDTVKDSADDATNNTATTDSSNTAAEHKRTTDATATGYAATKTAEEANTANTTTDDSTSNTDDAKQSATTANTKPAESAKTDRVVDMMERKNKRKKELDHETIKGIYLAEGSNAAIGRKYGVNAETVRRIKLGLRHAEITAPLRNAK